MRRNFRTFRLFISSTFSDFMAEREALQERVFPELERFCHDRGASFQAVDLRWGITEEAQQSHDTLRLCLEEIRRCQVLSSPPNFAVLLGDRYGWEPVPARIPKACWDRLVSAADEADQAIIEAAYRGLDHNAIPAVYQLKPSADGGAESQVAEHALLQALRRAADVAGFTGDERLAFFASATHQEIALGALAEQDETGLGLHPEEHVHVYIRRIPELPRDASAQTFLDWDVEHDAPDSDAHARLRALESQLQQRLPERCRSFSAGWQAGSADPTYIDAFCQQFLEDQKAIIEREFAQVQEEAPSALRNRAHLEFGTERSRNFRGRTNTLRRIARYLKGQRHAPLILHGEGGTGKSALLARAFDQARASGDQSVRLIRFIGGIPTTESLYTLLTTLTEDLALAYDQPEPSPAETIKEAIEAFGQALTWSGPERPLVLFLDALDQLENCDGAWMLQWLPKQPGKHTRIVASTRGGPTLQAAQRRYPQTCIELPAMPAAEGRAMLKAWLADTRDAYYSAGIAPVRAHRLSAEQFDWVIERFEAHGNPLWLKLAYEQVRHWTSYEPPRDLPATVAGMIEALIDQRLIAVENHPPVFTARALAYLSAARFGLSEEELNHALATDPEVIAEFEAQNARTGQEWLIDPDLPRLPPVLWSRLYFDLEPYLVSAFTDQTLLYRWFHREFDEVIAQRYLATPEQRETTHGHLAKMFEVRAPRNDDLFRRTDISAQPQAPALRRVMEQPWQLHHAGKKKGLRILLSNFGFCLAKSACLETVDLEKDFRNAGIARSVTLLSSNRHLLSRPYRTVGWKNHLVFLQLALEQYPRREMHAAASKWYKKSMLSECIPCAPNLMEQTPYMVLHASGSEEIAFCGGDNLAIPMRVEIDDASKNIRIFDSVTGQGRLFDGDGFDLGYIEVSSDENFGKPDSKVPRKQTIAGCLAWPLANRIWFCWKWPSRVAGQGGPAWLFYEYLNFSEARRPYHPRRTRHPNLQPGFGGLWLELPAKHLSNVATAVPLKNGGFATLGCYENLAALIVWPPLEDKTLDALAKYVPNPEIIMLPSGPPSANAGIVECSGGSLLIWPFNSDGIAACLNREQDMMRWKMSALWGFGSVVGAKCASLSNASERLILWDTLGKVILVKKEILDEVHLQGDQLRSYWMSQPIRRPPDRVWRSSTPFYMRGVSEVTAVYRRENGMLVAETDRSDGGSYLYSWSEARRPYSTFNAESYWNSKSGPMLSKSKVLECHPRESGEFLKLDESLDIDSIENDWLHWGKYIDGFKESLLSHYQITTSATRSSIRSGLPDAKNSQLSDWVTFWLSLIEDDRSNRPFYAAHRRLELLMAVSKSLAVGFADEFAAAVIQAEIISAGASEIKNPDGSLLSRLVATKNHDWQMLSAWLPFYKRMDPRGVRNECQRLLDRVPDMWQLLVVSSMFQNESSVEFILKASRQSDCPFIYRSVRNLLGVPVWEMFVKGKRVCWVNAHTEKLRFFSTGPEVIVAGNVSDGLRIMRFMQRLV